MYVWRMACPCMYVHVRACTCMRTCTCVTEALDHLRAHAHTHACTCTCQVRPAATDVTEALDHLRASDALRQREFNSFSGRILQLDAVSQTKREAATARHAYALQQQLVDSMRSPSSFSRPPPASARGPAKTPLPSLDTYLKRPATAREPPPSGLLLTRAPGPVPSVYRPTVR